MGDEEVHVVAAMLRDNITIEEIQFRKNNISDDGARALAAVLGERTALKFIDLRENRISISGIKVIADALERSERIHKVIVHPGGKIEAFGASETIDELESTAFAVKTLCIVDIREQKKQPESSVPKRSLLAERKGAAVKSGAARQLSQSPAMKHRPKKPKSADASRKGSKVSVVRQNSAPNSSVK